MVNSKPLASPVPYVQPIHITCFYKSVYDRKNEKLRPRIHLNVVSKCIIEERQGKSVKDYRRDRTF
jgi:hypothetical protein